MFIVRRRVHFEPVFLFGFEFGQLLHGQRISQMEGHEVRYGRLGPMREIASMHLELGFVIEEIGHS